MFTVPDQNDAVATCPAFSPAGPTPQGFFADCNPGQNFPGTRPIAEHFNELILNLHALLTKAHVTPAKGDPTMLWRSILNLPVVAQAVTLNVSTTGSATPVNPWAGDPFNSVAAALAFLYPYWIVPPAGSVTIQIAAGTYTSTTPILIEHPFGGNVTLLGAGPGATILVFTDCDGIRAQDCNLGGIRNLTVRGAGTGASKPNGIYIRNGQLSIDNVTAEQFRGNGFLIDRSGVSLVNTVTGNDNGLYGFFAINHSVVGGPGTLVANRNAGDGNVGLSASSGVIQVIQTTAGVRGVWFNAGAVAYVLAMSIGACTLGTEAVNSIAQSAILSPGTNPVANAWTVAAGQSFHADQMGLIVGGICLATANRPQCSPAINTIGNIDSYVQAT